MVGIFCEVPFPAIFLVDGSVLSSSVRECKVLDFKVTRLQKQERKLLEDLADSLRTYEKYYKKVQKDRTPCGEYDSAYNSVICNHIKVANFFNNKNSKAVQENINSMINYSIEYIKQGEIFTYEELADKILKDRVRCLETLGLSDIKVYGIELDYEEEKDLLWLGVDLRCECNKQDLMGWSKTIEKRAKFYCGNFEGEISFAPRKQSTSSVFIMCTLYTKIDKGFVTLSEEQRISQMKLLLRDFKIQVV